MSTPREERIPQEHTDGPPTHGEVTDLLLAWNKGDRAAVERLMPMVYARLRKLASGFLSCERSDHTLQSAELVHEAYLRLIRLDQVSWNDRAHFFALSARMMRRVLVDHARRVRSQKRGSEVQAVPLDLAGDASPSEHESLIALDQALRDLAERDPQQARIVELRYFGGMARDEIAEVLGISSATVTRRWRMARAWLFQQLSVSPRPGDG